MEKTVDYANNGLGKDTRDERTAAKNLRDVTMNMAGNYLETKKNIGTFSGLGIVLCLLGALILSFSQLVLRNAQAVLLNKPNDLFGIGLTIMLLLVAAGVALFIYSGRLENSYRYMQKPFYMDSQVKRQLQNDWDTIKSNNKTTIVIGVCFCALSLVPAIIGILIRAQNIFAIGIGDCLTLIIAAVSAYFIVKAVNVLDAYHKLLEIGHYEPAKKKARHYS